MKVLLILFAVLITGYFGLDRDVPSSLVVLQEKSGIPPGSSIWNSRDTLAFPHGLHVKSDGMECAVCHKNESGPRFTVEMCKRCHEEQNTTELKSIPVDSVIGFEPDQPIGFSHSLHMQIEGMDCKTCHTVRGKQKVGVGVCLTCHKEE